MDDSNKMPKGIPFIVANEFAERFCYYGINTILAVYMTQTLHFGQARATVWGHMFKVSAYFFPMLGAIISDVFWGKYRTILTFSVAYMVGCAVLALGPRTPEALFIGLGLMAFGTGGIKPCVSTNVGDQFTNRNQHLIERAFSYFYLSINIGSSISIWFCPVLLAKYGPLPAFGMPAAMMAVATVVFYLGRNKFAVVPPAGRQWLKEVFSLDGLRLVGRLWAVYLFVAVFWALWDQSNGTTWTLQATSDLMDKSIGFGITMLPSQVQVVNGLFIVIMVPIFTFGIYPFCERFFRVTMLRKIGAGLFLAAGSFMIISWIEGQIQAGHRVAVWWQMLAYVVLSAAEVLVSITALEFSYKQAPLRLKSFVMALYLWCIALGNLGTAVVNEAMVHGLPGSSVVAGAQTWVSLPAGTAMITGQKIDFSDNNGITVHTVGGEDEPLAGTYLVAEVQGNRVRLMDNEHRKPVATSGEWNSSDGRVSTYRLVGPQYFNFFVYLMAGTGLLFIFVAKMYREKTYVRED